MMVYNTPTDVVLEFYTPLSINKLLHNMGAETIPPIASDAYRYRNLLRPKFSINKNGEYKLFSSVSRGYTTKCYREDCKDCSRHGCYSEPSHTYRYQPDIDRLEGASEYNQSVNAKYISALDSIRIKF